MKEQATRKCFQIRAFQSFPFLLSFEKLRPSHVDSTYSNWIQVSEKCPKIKMEKPFTLIWISDFLQIIIFLFKRDAISALQIVCCKQAN